jgi:type IV secretory pathway TrbF-like protein
MEGSFAVAVRPDVPPKRHKPFTRPGSVNDDYRTMGRRAMLLGGAAFAAGGALGYAGLSRSAAPPAVLGVVIDRTGMVARSGFVDRDPELEELIARASLSEMIFNLRRFVPDEPRMREQLDRISPMFRDAGALRMRLHLQRMRQAYKKAIADKMRRVIEDGINTRLVMEGAKAPGGPRTFRSDWVEYWVDGRGNVVSRSRRAQWIELQVVKDDAIDPALRMLNTAALFVVDYQSSITD